MKSKIWYSFGNPFKIKFRKHHCFKCNNLLDVITHSKIVNSKSEEAKYYDFSIGENYASGNVEFIHKVFHCTKCNKEIEYVSQISYEGYVKWNKKFLERINKKFSNCHIQQYWIDHNDEIFESMISPIEIKENYVIIVEKEIKIPCIYLTQKNSWERPHYLQKNKKLIKQ